MMEMVLGILSALVSNLLVIFSWFANNSTPVFIQTTDYARLNRRAKG